MKTEEQKNAVINYTRKFIHENDVSIKKKEFGKPTCYLNGVRVSRRRIGGIIFCFAIQNGMRENYPGISSHLGYQLFYEMGA